MLKILKQTFSEFSDDKCSRMAAALAYYTAFSLAPLMVLIITIAGLVWDPSDVQGLVQSEIEGVVGEDGARQVKTMLSSKTWQSGGMLATIISGFALVMGATGMIGQLQGALNDAWEVKPDPEKGGVWSFVTKRLLSIGMILTISFLLLVSLVVSSVLTAAGDVVSGWLPEGMSQGLLLAMNVGVSVLVITALFAAMFKYLPDAEVAWSDVAVGALLTAVLFVAGKFAMGAYLGSKNMESTYGAAGSLALILLWVYYSSMILLLGAEFTQVWAKTRGSGVRPAENAVRVVQTEEHDRSHQEEEEDRRGSLAGTIYGAEENSNRS